MAYPRGAIVRSSRSCSLRGRSSSAATSTAELAVLVALRTQYCPRMPFFRPEVSHLLTAVALERRFRHVQPPCAYARTIFARLTAYSVAQPLLLTSMWLGLHAHLTGAANWLLYSLLVETLMDWQAADPCLPM
eukprot:UN3178